MNNWFSINQIDKETYIFSEYRHWEETHGYLWNLSDGKKTLFTGSCPKKKLLIRQLQHIGHFSP